MIKMMSIILAAGMVFSLTAAGMAEEPESTVKSQSVDINYSVPENFTWCVPNFQLGLKSTAAKSKAKAAPAKTTEAIGADGMITVTDACLKSTSSLRFSYTTANYSSETNENYLVCGDDKIAWELWGEYASENGETTPGEMDIVQPAQVGRDYFMLPEDGTQSVNFYIKAEAPSSHLAGTWTDTITFALEIVDR